MQCLNRETLTIDRNQLLSISLSLSLSRSLSLPSLLVFCIHGGHGDWVRDITEL